MSVCAATRDLAPADSDLTKFEEGASALTVWQLTGFMLTSPRQIMPLSNHDEHPCTGWVMGIEAQDLPYHSGVD